MKHVTAKTFEAARFFDLFERLPATFHRQCRSQFAAMDDDSTYVIDNETHRHGFLSPEGFSLRVISRRELLYRAHSFEICVNAKGIPLVEALEQFCEELRRLDSSDAAQLDLRPMKQAVKDSRASGDIQFNIDVTNPEELVSKALIYVLSLAGIVGEICITLGRPILLNRGSFGLALPVTLPSVLQRLKPTVDLNVVDGLEHLLEDSNFFIIVPERNILDHMKATNDLSVLGLNDEALEELEEFASRLRG